MNKVELYVFAELDKLEYLIIKYQCCLKVNELHPEPFTISKATLHKSNL